MTALDYFVIVVIAVSLVLGAARGLVRSTLSLISVIVGLLAAAYLYPSIGRTLGLMISSRVAADFVAFALIFLAVVLAGLLLARSIRGVLKIAKLTWTDHLLGAGFGLVRGWLICSVVYLALTAFPLRIEAVEKARLAPALIEGTRVVSHLGSTELRRQFEKGYEVIRRAWDSNMHKTGFALPAVFRGYLN